MFTGTTGPISTNLGPKHPLVKGIQVCSNEGPRPFPRGDDYELGKIHWQNFKNLFSRTTGPISTYMVQSIFGWRRYKFVQMKDHTLFQGEIITMYQKYIDEILKSSPFFSGEWYGPWASSFCGWKISLNSDGFWKFWLYVWVIKIRGNFYLSQIHVIYIGVAVNWPLLIWRLEGDNISIVHSRNPICNLSKCGHGH